MDSLEVCQEEDLLHLKIFCSSGIGNCLLEFSEQIYTNEILIQLYYIEGRSYVHCEYLEVTVSRSDQEKELSRQVRSEHFPG